MLPPAIKTQIELFGIGKALAALDIDGFLAQLDASEKRLTALEHTDAVKKTMTDLRAFAVKAKEAAEAFRAIAPRPEKLPLEAPE